MPANICPDPMDIVRRLQIAALDRSLNVEDARILLGEAVDKIERLREDRNDCAKLADEIHVSRNGEAHGGPRDECTICWNDGRL